MPDHHSLSLGQQVIVSWPEAGFLHGITQGKITRVGPDGVTLSSGFHPSPPVGTELTVRVPVKNHRGHHPPLFARVVRQAEAGLEIVFFGDRGIKPASHGVSPDAAGT